MDLWRYILHVNFVDRFGSGSYTRRFCHWSCGTSPGELHTWRGGKWVRLVQSRAGRKKGGRKQEPILPQGNKVFFKVREKSALRSSFQLLPRYTVNFYVKSTRYIACTEIQKTTEGEQAEGKSQGESVNFNFAFCACPNFESSNLASATEGGSLLLD